MKILFYFGHPAQYLFLRHSIRVLKEKGHTCDILIKSKDVLEHLLRADNESFQNILPEGRKTGRLGIIAGLIKRDVRLFKFSRQKNYDLFAGSDPSLSHVGFLRRIPVITVLEDDIEVIPQLARITFPFTTIILTPKGCKTGKYGSKTIHYNGYMKLAYLHPKWFKKTSVKLKQPYSLIRVSALNAYHDNKNSGFTRVVIEKIISILIGYGSVYISSESEMDFLFKEYELKIHPSEMQNVLANATMLVSDSQSMTMEAAMLGIPSIRYSGFAGKISVLEELEHRYKLTFGIRAGEPDQLYQRLIELLSGPELDVVFAKRREEMLSDKIDVTEFLVWFFERYPDSSRIMKENPHYQSRFSQ